METTDKLKDFNCHEIVALLEGMSKACVAYGVWHGWIRIRVGLGLMKLL